MPPEDNSKTITAPSNPRVENRSDRPPDRENDEPPDKKQVEHSRARPLGSGGGHGDGNTPRSAQRNALFSLSKKPSSVR